MSLSGFYGSREEALLFECGPRVAHCYDEAFQIEGRLIRAIPGAQWRAGRQSEWLAAATAQLGKLDSEGKVCKNIKLG